MPISVVFLGSPPFAVPSLQALAADPRFTIRLVVTQPDRPAGRGRKPRPPAVKEAAEALGLPVYQPETLRDPAAVDLLASPRADLFIVVAYGEILRQAVLDLPRHGCLNVHPSLLPRYRGSAPVQAAILNGDAETGVSIIKLIRRMDAGPILAQRRVPLDGTETAGSLSETLAAVAAAMLPDVAARWVAGEITPTPQDEAAATYTREITVADGRIDWSRQAAAIERLVRAMQPWPRAWTVLAGRRLAVLDCDISQGASTDPPGTINLGNRPPTVATGSTDLILLRVQPEGRREMAAEDWARGLRLPPGARFEPPEREGDDRGGA
ncbi:MAG: methionyl-tRNA formyltransferase [Sphaerobacter sp.]|nr:methionyl-tRNA formyltransferase [Sphaerobacter sp.]